MLVAAGEAAAQPVPSASACALGPIGTGRLKAALDGRTLALDDGRTVRLAAIEVPSGTDAAARSALAGLLAGRGLSLQGIASARDRYGRLLAFAFAAEAAEPAAPAQRILLAQGLARVAAHVGDTGCAAELLAAERNARAARLGLWADPRYAIRSAEAHADLLALRGRFALVEGRVRSVRASGATVYLNFGRRWSQDFTVTVARRHAPAFAAAGVELSKLSGRRVRVRGTVEERGGPWIEATRPEQIEIADRH